MDRLVIHNKLHYFLALLTAFLLPTARLVPIVISLMFLNWLVEGDLINKLKRVFTHKWAMLFISVYLVHLIGMFYTENRPNGWQNLEVKLSLLVFPLMILTRPFSQKQSNNIISALLTGSIAVSILLLGRASLIYFETGENHFFYGPFAAFLIHTSYLAMYFGFLIIWLILGLFDIGKIKSNFSKPLNILVILFLSVLIILLSSKSGILILLLTYFASIIYYIFHFKKYMIGAIGLGLFILSLFVASKVFPDSANRIKTAIVTVLENKKENDSKESTGVRILIWQAAESVFSRNLAFGVGTGDMANELLAEYDKRKFTGALEHRLNAHNQFYQILIGFGLFGLIPFALSLLAPLFNAFRQKDVLYIAFILISIINFFPESMLETMAGAMFYGFFNSLLFFKEHE